MPDTELWPCPPEDTSFQTQHDPETVVGPPTGLSLPGSLTVRLFEGVGLSVPTEAMGLLDDQQRTNLVQTTDDNKSRALEDSSSQCRPYAILDFDRSEIAIGSHSASIRNPKWSADGGLQTLDVFRASKLTIRIYLGITRGTGQAICLGSGTVVPSATMSEFSEKWLVLNKGTGKIRLGLRYAATNDRPQHCDFASGKAIGETKSGKVLLARKTDTRQSFAVKKVRKIHENRWFHMVSGVRFDLNHSFIAPVYGAFQENEIFCLISPHISGGHLFSHLQQERRFDTAKARFYAAELTCALEYLHDMNIVCRGLWPGNLLLDASGHVIVADFSLHHREELPGPQGNVALLEYPAPELLQSQTHTKETDWWSLGVFLYEMLTGIPPFYADDREIRHRNILTLKFEVPKTLHSGARDILRKLLAHDPHLRLGTGGALEVKEHSFFCDIDWRRLVDRQLEPPFQPEETAMPFQQDKYPPQKSLSPQPLPPLRKDKLPWLDFLREDEQHKKFCAADGSVRLVRASEGSLMRTVIDCDHDRLRSQVKEISLEKDRVIGTKALGLAVEHRDLAMVRILLDASVFCDFHEYDRPCLPSKRDGCTFGESANEITEPPEFLPPLLRAVKLGDEDLVKMLLAGGADPNVGFHDNDVGIYQAPSTTTSHHPPITCGRAVQLAIALGHESIGQILIDAGADIDILASVLRCHKCRPIYRPTYLKVTARLKEMAN